jgi:fumarate hydratase class II
VSVLSHLRGHVITNDRVQASHEHQTIIQLEMELKALTSEEFDQYVRPELMLAPKELK